MTTALVPLKSLAQEIQDEHLMCEQAAGSAIEHAIKAGELLIEAKARPDIKHGEWGDWIRDNFEFTQQTSAGYMRIARSQIEGGPSFSSVNAALAELAEPREAPEGDERPGKHASDDITAAEYGETNDPPEGSTVTTPEGYWEEPPDAEVVEGEIVEEEEAVSEDACFMDPHQFADWGAVLRAVKKELRDLYSFAEEAPHPDKAEAMEKLAKQLQARSKRLRRELDKETRERDTK